MANAISCKAWFSMGKKGWSETHYFVSKSNPTPTFEEAQAAFERYLSDRASLYAPGLVYGLHFNIDAVGYTREDGTGEGWVDWNPTITIPNAAAASAGTTAVEPPFMGAGFRLWATNIKVARDILIRPLPNTAHADPAGKPVASNFIWDPASELMRRYVAAGVWAIKALDPTKPVKPVTEVITGNLPQGECYLNIPSHGYSKGQEVKFKGGKPVHKSVRGRHIVLAVPDANTIHVRPGKAITPGPSSMKAQEVAYDCQLITSFARRRIEKRDTGRPIAEGHGRR